MGSLSEIRVVRRDAQPYVGLPVQVSMSNWGDAMARIPDVYAWLAQRGIPPAGPLVFRYRFIGDMEIPWNFELALPTATRIDVGAGEMIADELPAGLYVTATHHGHPDALFDSIMAVERWTADHGLTQDTHDDKGRTIYAGRFEFYRSDPEQEPDMDRWETDLVNKLVEDDAARALERQHTQASSPHPAA